MNFDDKYPDIKYKEFLDNSLYKDEFNEQCLICGDYTHWRFFWSKRNSNGYPIMLKTYICSEDCLDYYNIVKELFHEND